MTNEEILEEILHESHELGFDKEIFELLKNFPIYLTSSKYATINLVFVYNKSS